MTSREALFVCLRGKKRCIDYCNPQNDFFMVKRGILKRYQMGNKDTTYIFNKSSKPPPMTQFLITQFYFKRLSTLSLKRMIYNYLATLKPLRSCGVDYESVWRNHDYTKRTNHWNKVNKSRNFTYRHNNLERVLVNPHGRLVFLHHRVSSQDIHTRSNLKAKYVQFVQIKTDFTRHTGVIITPRRVSVREQYAGRRNIIYFVG